MCDSCASFHLKDGIWHKSEEWLNSYFCEICGEGGTLICCDQQNCKKHYCLSCLKNWIGIDNLNAITGPVKQNDGNLTENTANPVSPKSDTNTPFYCFTCYKVEPDDKSNKLVYQHYEKFVKCSDYYYKQKTKIDREDADITIMESITSTNPKKSYKCFCCFNTFDMTLESMPPLHSKFKVTLCQSCSQNYNSTVGKIQEIEENYKKALEEAKQEACSEKEEKPPVCDTGGDSGGDTDGHIGENSVRDTGGYTGGDSEGKIDKTTAAENDANTAEDYYVKPPIFQETTPEIPIDPELKSGSEPKITKTETKESQSESHTVKPEFEIKNETDSDTENASKSPPGQLQLKTEINELSGMPEKISEITEQRSEQMQTKSDDTNLGDTALKTKIAKTESKSLILPNKEMIKYCLISGKIQTPQNLDLINLIPCTSKNCHNEFSKKILFNWISDRDRKSKNWQTKFVCFECNKNHGKLNRFINLSKQFYSAFGVDKLDFKNSHSEAKALFVKTKKVRKAKSSSKLKSQKPQKIRNQNTTNPRKLAVKAKLLNPQRSTQSKLLIKARPSVSKSFNARIKSDQPITQRSRSGRTNQNSVYYNDSYSETDDENDISRVKTKRSNSPKNVPKKPNNSRTLISTKNAKNSLMLSKKSKNSQINEKNSRNLMVSDARSGNRSSSRRKNTFYGSLNTITASSNKRKLTTTNTRSKREKLTEKDCLDYFLIQLEECDDRYKEFSCYDKIVEHLEKMKKKC